MEGEEEEEGEEETGFPISICWVSNLLSFLMKLTFGIILLEFA